MCRTNAALGELVDAVAVCAAGEQILLVLGPLAASPLHEQATTRMRVTLARAGSPAVRRAIRRLCRPVGESLPAVGAVPASAVGVTGGAGRQAPPAPCPLTSCAAPGGAA